MHGSRLVPIERLVTLAADPDDPVIDDVASWAHDRDIEAQTISFGEEPAVVPDRTLGLSVGGDGTFLEAIRTFAPNEVPIAGVSRGTLAFLSRIPPEHIRGALREMRRGEAAILDRQRYRLSGAGIEETGLNDVTVEPPATMDRNSCRLRVFVDDEYVGEYTGGGLVIATPTGSTAMGLSAGGPIHYPAANQTLELIALHHDGLGAHPLVFDADREITIIPASTVEVWIDGGRVVKTVGPDATLYVTGTTPAHVVRTSYEETFMQSLSSKLSWGLRGPDPPDLEEPPGGVSARILPRAQQTLDPADRAARAQHRAFGQEPGGPVALWRALQSERPPRVGWWRDPSPWPVQDERPDWLRSALGVRTHAGTPAHEDLRTAARRTACEAAVAAGELAHRYYRRLHGAEAANRDELVDNAQDASGQILAAIVANAFPDHEIQIEDALVRSADSPYRWLLDPVDGIGNFEHGNPSFCTTLALLEDGIPVVGVVYAPAADELFHAVRDGIACRNDGYIEPTDRTALDDSMLLSGYDPDGEFLRHFYQETRGVRRLGSQALNLCYVAAGSADALWEFDTYAWDVAAGVCILRAAGGQVTDADGDDYTVTLDPDEHRPLLASNGSLHPALLGLLATTDD